MKPFPAEDRDAFPGFADYYLLLRVRPFFWLGPSDLGPIGDERSYAAGNSAGNAASAMWEGP